MMKEKRVDTKKYKLPEGVGKKIVDALQKQNGNPILNENSNNDASLAYSPLNLSSEINDISIDESFDAEEDLLSSVSEKINNLPSDISAKQSPIKMFENGLKEDELPKNVKMLLKLVSQLPPNVTKQTGALIIRQTIEAMGIPIKTVLTEAQQIQENLGFTVREYMNNIEEYRTNIKMMEEQIQVCKKQSRQLADLINLFILSD